MTLGTRPSQTGRIIMKKNTIELKNPPVKPNQKKALKKAVEEEPLAEGFIQEPHADYGLLNDETNVVPVTK